MTAVVLVDQQPPDPVGGSEAQHLARELLSRAGFHRDDPGFVTRAVNWLLAKLEHAFLGGTGSRALLIVVVVLVAPVAFAIWKAGPIRRHRHAAERTDDPLAPDQDLDHRAEARRLTAQARYAEALREWLRASVQTIESRGVLMARPGRTGAGVAREAGPLLPSASEPLRQAALVFDEVWFGTREATADDVELARIADEAVQQARPVAGTPDPDTFAMPR